MESNFRRSLVMSEGDISIFFTRPITVVLLTIAIITLFTPIFKAVLQNKRNGKGELL